MLLRAVASHGLARGCATFNVLLNAMAPLMSLSQCHLLQGVYSIVMAAAVIGAAVPDRNVATGRQFCQRPFAPNAVIVVLIGAS
eukprot:4064025-Pyramimonas_sp.AAC.1